MVDGQKSASTWPAYKCGQVQVEICHLSVLARTADYCSVVHSVPRLVLTVCSRRVATEALSRAPLGRCTGPYVLCATEAGGIPTGGRPLARARPPANSGAVNWNGSPRGRKWNPKISSPSHLPGSLFIPPRPNHHRHPKSTGPHISAHPNPKMVRLRSRYLTCFYCGKRSDTRFDGGTRQFTCKHCDATNHLDEVRRRSTTIGYSSFG